MPPEQNGTHSEIPTRYTQMRQYFSDSYWRGIFDKYDLDKDGRISHDELRIIMLEYQNKAVPVKTAEEVILLVDKDNSGNLDFEEFKAMMHHPDLKMLFGHFMTRYVDSITAPRDPHLEGAPGPGWNIPLHTSYRDGTGRYEKVYPYTCWPPPIFMITVSILEIVLCFSLDSGEDWLIYDPQKREQVWRFFTYMLVHRDLLHLFVNVIIQLVFGIPLEMRQRSWRVAVVYLAGVAAGPLAMSVCYPAWRVNGASAGVYAVFTAHFAILLLNWPDKKRPTKQLITFTLLAALDWGYFFCKRYWNPDRNISNQYVTHIAGAVAGILVGIGVLRNLEEKKWERRVWWIAVAIYSCLLLVIILINIFWKEHFTSYPTRP